jgi:microcystin-dependent protein
MAIQTNHTNDTLTPTTGTLAVSGAATLTTALAAIYGGTGQSTFAVGDLLLGAASNTLSKLNIGLNTYVLTSNGTTASWQAPAAGGSNITALGMWENNRTISANYTIGSTNSAMSSGPITINSGVVVTIPSGSRWVVL